MNHPFFLPFEKNVGTSAETSEGGSAAVEFSTAALFFEFLPGKVDTIEEFKKCNIRRLFTTGAPRP